MMDAAMFVFCYQEASQLPVMSGLYLRPQNNELLISVIDSTSEC